MQNRWQYAGHPQTPLPSGPRAMAGRPPAGAGRGRGSGRSQPAPPGSSWPPAPPAEPMPPAPPALPLPPPPPPPSLAPSGPKPRHLSATCTIYDPLLDPQPVKKSQTPVIRRDGEGLGSPRDPREPWAVAGKMQSTKALISRLEVVEYQWDKHSTGPAPPPPACAILATGLSPLAPASELHRHFAQFGRIAEHRLELDPRTGASLGILRVRFTDDIARHEDGSAYERTASGRQDGHAIALEAIKRTHGTRVGPAFAGGAVGVFAIVVLDRDGSKCAAAVKAEVERRYPPQPEKPLPSSLFSRNKIISPQPGMPPHVQPGVIRHSPHGITPPLPHSTPPPMPGLMPPGPLGSSAGPLKPTPASTAPPGKAMERAAYTRKDDPNPPKLPAGPHLYNQGPNPHLRAAAEQQPFGPMPPGPPPGMLPPHSMPPGPFAGPPPGWVGPPPSMPPPPFAFNAAVPPPGFGPPPGRGPPAPLQPSAVHPPQAPRAMYNGRGRGAVFPPVGDARFQPRQQPLMLKARPMLKQSSKNDDDMEMGSSASDSESEDEKDRVFFPRTDAAPRQHALNIVPMQGGMLRGPRSAPLPRTMAPIIVQMTPRQIALRRLATNAMPHLVIDQSRLAGATEAITEPHLRAHFKDFRPSEIFSDGTKWYLTFTTYDTARRAQLVLERKTLQGVELHARVEPPPTMADVYAPAPATAVPIIQTGRGAEQSIITPGKLSYTARSFLPPSPTRRGPYTTDRELAKDARNIILNDLLVAFERDLRVRFLEPEVRKVVERRADRVNKADEAHGGRLQDVKPEAGASVKLPSFARKAGVPARQRVKDEPRSPAKAAKKKDKRVSETPDAESETSDARPTPRQKLVRASDQAKLAEASRSGSEDVKPRIARRLSFTDSEEEDDQEPVTLPPRVVPKPGVEPLGEAWLDVMEHEVSRKPTRMDLDLSSDEGEAAPVFVKPVYHFDPREDLPRPDPFDPEMAVAEDEEDLHYVRLALERLRVGESLHPYPEDAPDRQIEPEHASGSARTEGYYKIAPAAKSAYLPLRNKAQVDVSHVSATAVSRAARATTRRFVAGIGQQSKALTSDADVVKFNQLRSRKKQLKFARSPIHDWGLYAMEYIPAGEMICEYVGEVVRQQVADKRERMYERQGIGSSYLFRLDDEYVVDATKKGSISRLINHCCTPNSTARIITIGGSKKIVIYAGQPLEPGDEVLYDYKFSQTEGEERIPCLCGSAGCRKYLN